MERKVLKNLFLGLCLTAGMSASSVDALVSPLVSKTGNAGWLAFISIKDEIFGDYYTVCSGVLIDPEWVLSSQGCLVDPFETIEAISSQNDIRYFIELWGQLGIFEVVNSIASPAGGLVMHKLDRPAVTSPVKRSTLKSSDLLGVRVEVPGVYESESLGNAVFNPEGRIKVNCKVRGELFLSDGSFCFVVSPIYFVFPMAGSFGTIIDPRLSGPLSSPLDDELDLELVPEEIFVDFDDGSFPCHEDIGSPVVATINGQTQMVGLVNRVGIAARLPICTNSLYNVFTATLHYEEFIQQTLVRDAFDSDCPVTTELRLDELANNTIRLSWTRQHSATGYKILFTPRLGYEPIQSVEVGNVTELSAAIDPDATYYVSLLAYNESCTSTPSDPVLILLNKP